MDDRLRENAVVTVSVPPHGPLSRVRDFDATVIAVLESGVALDPLGVRVDHLARRAEDVFVSFVHAGQLVGLKGTLTCDHGRGLRFRVQDGVRVRRRNYTRVAAELPVTLQRADTTDPHSAATVNLAPEGLLVRAELPVELQEPLEELKAITAGDAA